jgi:predicted MFS family arabinose efflux permease
LTGTDQPAEPRDTQDSATRHVGMSDVLSDPVFRRFWLAETISVFGSQVTELALPLTAVLLLHASSSEMGLLTAVGLAPYPIFGLLAGVWVDRFPRRLVLIATDVGGALAAALIPIAAVLHGLSLPIVFLVQFVLGFKEVVARPAVQSIVPGLVGRGHLVQANARLEASASVATTMGPGLGGVLVEVLTAPLALAIDAGSYVLSAALLSRTRSREPARPRSMDGERNVRGELTEGLRLVTSSPLLRALVAGGAIHSLFSRMIDALVVLYMVDEVSLQPVQIGLVYAAVGPGALLGAILVKRVDRLLGVGGAVLWLQVVTGISRLLIPFAGGPSLAAIAVLAGSNFTLGFARTAFNVTQVSLRVAMTPDHLHGRLNATFRFLIWSVTPVGALAGGLLASTDVGLRNTLLLAGLGVLFAAVPFLSRPLRSVRDVPAYEPSAVFR